MASYICNNHKGDIQKCRSKINIKTKEIITVSCPCIKVGYNISAMGIGEVTPILKAISLTRVMIAFLLVQFKSVMEQIVRHLLPILSPTVEQTAKNLALLSGHGQVGSSLRLIVYSVHSSVLFTSLIT